MSAITWQSELLGDVAAHLPAGYAKDGEPATEPTALACLALTVHGRFEEARTAAKWLAKQQNHNGSLGVTPSRPSPGWPTSLAVLAWRTFDRETKTTEFTHPIVSAIRWTLDQRGETIPRSDVFGHDSTLAGWSWAANTHSWIEPTAMFVVALKAVGQSEHPRTREAVRLLIDRQLPGGGCNYGNTIVLGQALVAHVEPTGLAMLALAGEGDDDPRIEKSISYLQAQLSPETATASLCYALLGLTAHNRRPPQSAAWLEHACERVKQQGGSPFKQALIALAEANAKLFPNAIETNSG